MGLYNRFCKRFFAAVIIRLTAQSDSRALSKPSEHLPSGGKMSKGLLESLLAVGTIGSPRISVLVLKILILYYIIVQ